MAANAKDARRRSIGRKEMTPEVVDRDGSPALVAPVIKKGRKGIIRKKPLYKRSAFEFFITVQVSDIKLTRP
jgi:hypothetical protein